MTYSIRVRLYRDGALEADTDPDLEPDAPGAEVVATLFDAHCAVAEVCQAMHGPGAQLLGFGPHTSAAHGAVLRELAKAPQFTYPQGYAVLQGGSAEWWLAQVDIALSR